MGRKNQESPWFLADAELSGEGGLRGHDVLSLVMLGLRCLWAILLPGRLLGICGFGTHETDAH